MVFGLAEAFIVLAFLAYCGYIILRGFLEERRYNEFSGIFEHEDKLEALRKASEK